MAVKLCRKPLNEADIYTICMYHQAITPKILSHVGKVGSALILEHMYAFINVLKLVSYINPYQKVKPEPKWSLANFIPCVQDDQYSLHPKK